MILVYDVYICAMRHHLNVNKRFFGEIFIKKSHTDPSEATVQVP